MKQIPLNHGKFAIVDDEDFERLSKFKWRLSHNGYAIRTMPRTERKRIQRMHRVVLQTPDGLFTDHINCNKLDNRKANLRFCNSSQNKMNIGKKRNNHTGHKGVVFHKASGKYMARIRLNSKDNYLGLFKSALAAGNAYAAAAKKLHGEFSRT